MEFPKIASSEDELLFWTKLLPAIRDRYGSAFKLLEVPEVLRFDTPTRVVYFRHYDGKTYNDSWNEFNGGSTLGTELSTEMVQILDDLRTIDVPSLLAANPVGEYIERSSFDLRGWLQSFRERTTDAIRMGISSDEVERAEEFVAHDFTAGLRIISNGDFYPRNLIRLENKIVLVDWAHWAGYRVCCVDHLVNVAAFAYVHMWGNSTWQRNFVRQLRDSLDIGIDDFRRAVVIKSFEQGGFWLNNPDLKQQVAAQVNHFKMALGNTISE